MQEKWLSEYIEQVNANKLDQAIQVLLDNVRKDQMIYKYCRGLSRDLKNLQDHMHWLSSAYTFNDPSMSKPIFSIDSSYKPIFRHVEEAADAGMVEKICREANETYEQMLRAHADLNSAALMHWKQCCERAAIYLTMKKYYPETTMEWLNETLREYGIHTGASLNKLLNHRIMKALFLPIMRTIAKTTFGPKGGFKNQFGVMNKQEANFDILECPYCKYLQELGCPELGPGFCRSDEYVYGNLDAFAFERTQTLATGGEKCDFCLRKR